MSVNTIEYIKHTKGSRVCFPPSSSESIKVYTDGAGARPSNT